MPYTSPCICSCVLDSCSLCSLHDHPSGSIDSPISAHAQAAATRCLPFLPIHAGRAWPRRHRVQWCQRNVGSCTSWSTPSRQKNNPGLLRRPPRTAPAPTPLSRRVNMQGRITRNPAARVGVDCLHTLSIAKGSRLLYRGEAPTGASRMYQVLQR